MKNNQKKIVLKFNLPEFNKQDINVRVEKNKALIQAHRTIEKKGKRDGFFYDEKVTKQFGRSVQCRDQKPSHSTCSTSNKERKSSLSGTDVANHRSNLAPRSPEASQ